MQALVGGGSAAAIAVAVAILIKRSSKSQWTWLATKVGHAIFSSPLGYYAMRYALKSGRKGRSAAKTRRRAQLAMAARREFGPFHVLPIPYNADNFAYLIVDTENDCAAVVDPADEDAVQTAMREWYPKAKLYGILTTHWHWDHSAGNAEL
ncbi:hypothetical protein BJ742DRAFT_303591 [Cladochytrium replicatum]|nr:hypothetical protein BJ742DRAFT_303591 [Cladochytrium replicatum]